MVATASEPRALGNRPRRRWLWAFVAAPVLLVAAASWWLTAPLEQIPGGDSPAPPPGETSLAWQPMVETSQPVWPETSLDGDPAKRLLLDVLLVAAERIEQVPGYTATFRKQERLNGKLGDEQTLLMKIRHEPFSIYLKFLEPTPGKEVIYAEGRHNNKVIAHRGDWTRALVPRLAVDPESSLALADSRRPVTEAGIAKLIHKLIGYREMDLDDPHAETFLDRVTTDDGRELLRSIHRHPHPKPERPFALVEVRYDPETFWPVQISSHDWTGPDHEGQPPLAERYVYEDIDTDVELSDRDFDPANPEYGFQRF